MLNKDVADKPPLRVQKEIISGIKTTIDFCNDLKIHSYWKQWSGDDVFVCERYTKAGLVLLTDPNGESVIVPKRNCIALRKVRHWMPDLREMQAAKKDNDAVDRFAQAMKNKLASARAKGRGGWDDPLACTDEQLAVMLHEHLHKGNAGSFEDIANFAMMLHQRGADPAVLISCIMPTRNPI